MNMGIVAGLIKALAPGVDPDVIEQAVTDWLDDHPEATTTVQDGSITEEKLAQDVLADLAEIPSLKEAIENVLVNGTGEQVTLTNANNVSDFYTNASNMDGVAKTSLTDGVATYTANGRQEMNPYVYQTLGYTTKKWLVGMKLKFTKLDQSLTDPTGFYVRLGKYGSFITKTFPVTWGEWIDLTDVNEYELNRIQIYASFASAPAANTFSMEIKNMYVYDVSEVSADMIDIIKTAQSANYQDGEVTYSSGGGDGLVPDKTLTEEGKCADSKAVGDAIANAVKAPMDNSLSGVVFGTSLTARAVSGDGYMDYLPDLIGIDFDNQGIGSALITGGILSAIKGYTYTGKDVCLIEGFVNDWKFDNTLGTWKDTSESTACGALRSAINYIYTQNPNITLFIVFDHYGRDYQNDDRSSTAENTASLTQYEYYEEMAKVAESLGAPVIKLYAESQISEKTPQYLYDYIHDNALGAKQSANLIYSKMKQYFQNEQSNS